MNSWVKTMTINQLPCLKAEIVGGHNGQDCLSGEEEDDVFETAAKVFLVWIPRLNKWTSFCGKLLKSSPALTDFSAVFFVFVKSKHQSFSNKKVSWAEQESNSVPASLPSHRGWWCWGRRSCPTSSCHPPSPWRCRPWCPRWACPSPPQFLTSPLPPFCLSHLREIWFTIIASGAHDG